MLSSVHQNDPVLSWRTTNTSGCLWTTASDGTAQQPLREEAEGETSEYRSLAWALVLQRLRADLDQV